MNGGAVEDRGIERTSYWSFSSTRSSLVLGSRSSGLHSLVVWRRVVGISRAQGQRRNEGMG